MRRSLGLAVTLAALVVVVGGSILVAGRLNANAATQGAVVGVTVGQTHDVVLKANPSTGHAWSVEFDEKLLELVGSEFKADSELMGAPGEETFTFRALSSGKAKVTFTYQRPWEDETLQKQIYTFKIKAS